MPFPISDFWQLLTSDLRSLTSGIYDLRLPRPFLALFCLPVDNFFGMICPRRILRLTHLCSYELTREMRRCLLRSWWGVCGFWGQVGMVEGDVGRKVRG